MTPAKERALTIALGRVMTLAAGIYMMIWGLEGLLR